MHFWLSVVYSSLFGSSLLGLTIYLIVDIVTMLLDSRRRFGVAGKDA